MKRVLAGLVGLGLLIKLAAPQGLARRIEIVGRLPMHPPTSEPAPIEMEVWFPEVRVLFDSRGRQWYRNPCGRLLLRADRHAYFNPSVTAAGQVRIQLTLTTWRPPRRCTVQFVEDGFVTRFARNAPCQGWGTSLTARLPEIPPALSLRDEAL